MEHYVKLQADGGIMLVTKEECSMEEKMQFWYKELDCELVEIVRAKYLEEPYVIICDEEFLYTKPEALNPAASLLYGTHEHGHPIMGDVLIGKDKVTDEGLETVGYDFDEAVSLMKKVMDVVFAPIMKGEEE